MLHLPAQRLPGVEELLPPLIRAAQIVGEDGQLGQRVGGGIRAHAAAAELRAPQLLNIGREQKVDEFPFRNLDGRIIADSGGVVPDVADGSCYVGVTLEENARKAIADGLDVAIVYPAEGTSVLPDGAAIVRGCAHEENARKFIDFLLSPDVQQLLGTELSRRSVRTDTASDALPELTVLPTICAARMSGGRSSSTPGRRCAGGEA